jgi:hypothetical protein
LAEKTTDKWAEWIKITGQQQHGDRFPLMRVVRYEAGVASVGVACAEPGQSTRTSVETPAAAVADSPSGSALMLNFSRGGMCLLTDGAPSVGTVWRLQVPRSVPIGKPTSLAEVRWTRPLPFPWESAYIVGLKFLSSG